MDDLVSAGGLEYSGAYHGLAVIGGRRVPGPHGYATRAHIPETRRPAVPPRRPDLPVVGRALVFNTIIRDDEGHADLFDASTEWEVDPAGVALHINHAGLVGHCRVVPGDDGLYVNGAIYAPMGERAARLGSMSARLASLESRVLPDGTIHHTRARVVEVSLTDRPACPGTRAVFGVRPDR